MAKPDRGLSPMFWYLLLILIIIFIIGIIGFRILFEVGWIDASYQTAMATSTLGLSATSVAETDSQKLFIGVLAIVSAILFIGIGTHLVSEIIRMHDEKLENVKYENSSERYFYYSGRAAGSAMLNG